MPPAGPHPWLLPAVRFSALTPLLHMVWQAGTGGLAADPVADVLNRLGLTALVLLLASLTVTPLRLASGFGFLAPLRRTLGLFGFFYASLHVVTYAVVDQGLDLAAIVEDVVKRPFILAGATAFLLLVPLAATSPRSMVKRLGAVRWKKLHRLAYVAPAFAVLHFFLRVKKDVSEPLAYALVLALLLSARLAVRLRARRAERLA